MPLESMGNNLIPSNYMLITLSESTLFRGLALEELRLLDTLFEPYIGRQGTMIFKQGEPAVYMYLLLNGLVEVQYKPYDGPPLTVARVNTGSVFGWSAVVGSATYTSGAYCAEDVAAVRVEGDALRMLCNQHPETGKIILDRLAELVSARWQHSHYQIRAMLDQGIKASANGSAKGGKTVAANNRTTEDQIKGLINQLSAYIEQYHGGSVEFVSYNGKELQVRLGGACQGCPLSPATLHGWVAGTVRQFFPEIESVQSV
jgi:CRP-like cAMP-binding protein